MSEPASERRLAENEVVFRGFNEQVQKSIDAANEIAAEEGEEPIGLDGDKTLEFYCECSDENCTQRTKISPNKYNKIHKARNVFTIVNGHQVEKIEDVTHTEPEYSVVTKHVQPPPSTKSLNITSIDKS